MFTFHKESHMLRSRPETCPIRHVPPCERGEDYRPFVALTRTYARCTPSRIHNLSMITIH